MRRSRIVLTLFAALVALAVAAAILLWSLVRLAWFERHAGEWLSRQLATPVTVGSLAIGYLPSPALTVGGLTVASGSQPQAPALLELGRARVVLPWRALRGGALRATRLEMDAPKLSLGVDAQGRGNWEPLVERLASLGSDEPSTWAVGALEIANGAVNYTDARDGARLTLTGLTLSAADVTPGEFFPLQLRLAGHGADFAMHATVTGEAMLDPDRDLYAARGLAYRGWLGGLGLHTGGVELAGTLVKQRADLAAGTVTFDGIGFEGLGLKLAGNAVVTEFATDPRIAFDFSSEPFAPRALANSLNRPLPDTSDPTALARAQATIKGQYLAGQLTLESVEGRLDETQVSGRVDLPATGPPRVQLSFDRIDLDRYLPPGEAAPGTPQATLESLLDDLVALDLDADLRFGEAKTSGITARGLRVAIEPGRPGDKP